MPPALESQMTVVVGSGASAFTVAVDLALSEGVLVLFGPSGAGKSLTVQALAGLIKPKGGFLRVQGETLFDADRRIWVAPHRRRIGYVPQLHALFPFLDVFGNIAFGLPRAARRRDNPRIKAVLSELGIEQLASARPSSLSGGERQRVALARALVVEPRLLLLDEPLASIDQEGRAALRKALKDAIVRRGMPAVLVTHDPEEALAMGDTLVRFERGRTTVTGAPMSLLGRGQPVIVEGEVEEAAKDLGEARAQIALGRATIEGPAELLKAAPGEPIRLELRTRPRRRS
jgi:molybdate transport system ATP-binding protein